MPFCVLETRFVKEKEVEKILKTRVLYRICCVVVVIVVLSLPIWLTPDLVRFENFQSVNIVQLLGLLFLITLFQERTLEVIVITWWGPSEARLENQIQRHQRKISELKDVEEEGDVDETALEQELKNLEDTRERQTENKSKKQRFALLTSLSLGLLISAVGIRTLGSIVDRNALNEISRLQSFAFRVVDVLLTGGVIAGGSEGIHKIANIYNAFTENAASKGKAGKD